jgi:hypothetical protein
MIVSSGHDVLIPADSLGKSVAGPTVPLRRPDVRLSATIEDE